LAVFYFKVLGFEVWHAVITVKTFLDVVRIKQNKTSDTDFLKTLNTNPHVILNLRDLSLHSATLHFVQDDKNK